MRLNSGRCLQKQDRHNISTETHKHKMVEGREEEDVPRKAKIARPAMIASRETSLPSTALQNRAGDSVLIWWEDGKQIYRITGTAPRAISLENHKKKVPASR